MRTCLLKRMRKGIKPEKTRAALELSHKLGMKNWGYFIIGLPGDHVECCNALGQMSVNGVPLDEPYIFLPPGDTKASEVDFDEVVPDDSLWVMGDNRNNSKDSRYNGETPLEGFVPIDNVVGRAFVVSWPVDHWAWLGNYPEVFDGVDEAGEEAGD